MAQIAQQIPFEIYLPDYGIDDTLVDFQANKEFSDVIIEKFNAGILLDVVLKDAEGSVGKVVTYGCSSGEIETIDVVCNGVNHVELVFG